MGEDVSLNYGFVVVSWFFFFFLIALNGMYRLCMYGGGYWALIVFFSYLLESLKKKNVSLVFKLYLFHGFL